MIRVLIVDDEAPAHAVLGAHCRKIDDIEVVGNCYDGTSALAFLRQHPVDLMLLDMQMSDLTGFEVLHTLVHPPCVVFVTAYSDYALESYDFGVTDYLLKPVRYARFVAAIEKVRRYLRRTSDESGARTEDAPGEAISDTSVLKSETAFIRLKIDGVTERIDIRRIACIEAWGNYVKIHLAEHTILERRTLTDLEAVLSEHGFVRIHKAWIVQLRIINAIDGNRVRIGEKYLPIGAIYKQKLRDLISSNSV
jgi:two-component system LytT family response regulator